MQRNCKGAKESLNTLSQSIIFGQTICNFAILLMICIKMEESFSFPPEDGVLRGDFSNAAGSNQSREEKALYPHVIHMFCPPPLNF